MHFHGNKGRDYLERKIVKNVTENHRREEGGGKVTRFETEQSLMILDRALKIRAWTETWL